MAVGKYGRTASECGSTTPLPVYHKTVRTCDPWILIIISTGV